MKLSTKMVSLILLVSLACALFVVRQGSTNNDDTPPPEVEETSFGSPELDEASQIASDLTITALETVSKKEREIVLRDVVDLYTLLHESDPEQVGHLNNRGVTYMFLEEYEKAVSDFNQVLSQEPLTISARSNRAIAYKKLGDLEKAVLDYQIYIALVEELSASSWEEGALGEQLELMRSQFEDVKEELLRQGIEVPDLDPSLVPQPYPSSEEAESMQSMYGSIQAASGDWYGLSKKHQRFYSNGTHTVLNSGWGCSLWLSGVDNVENEVFHAVPSGAWNRNAYHFVFSQWSWIPWTHFFTDPAGWTRPGGTNYVTLVPETGVCSGMNDGSNYFRISGNY